MDNELIKKMTEARKGVVSENNPVKKLLTAEKPTRSMAIRAFCSQCMGCDAERIEPGFISDIRNCTSIRCALYDFRPYQR